MGTGRPGDVIRHLGHATAPTDGHLLADYVRRGDPAALAALVRRHGPMVWAVCRRQLADHHAAEDAFQATFLVLVRRAGQVADPDAVANWLYGVARRTARKARATAARRRERPASGAEPIARDPDPADDLRAVLDDEIGRLPDIYRSAVVLCDLEGLTRRVAARRLGVPDGTLAARLARGRSLLAGRLARRGLAPPAAAVAPFVSPAACSAGASALARQVLLAMRLAELKLAAVGVLAVAGLTAALFAAAPVPGAGPAAWKEAFALSLDHPATTVAVTADRLAVGDAGGNVFLYDPATGANRRHALIGGKSYKIVDRVHLQPDGAVLWAVVNGRKDMWQIDLRKPNLPGHGAFGNLGVSANGDWWLENHDPKLLCVRPNLNHLDVRPARHHDWEDAVRFPVAVAEAEFSPDSKWLAVRTADDRLRVYDWADPNRDLGKNPAGTPVAARPATAVRFSADGKRLAVVGPDGYAAVFDPATGKELFALAGHRGAVRCVAFHPNGQSIATGGDDATVRFWSGATGRAAGTLDGHKGAVRAIAFAAAGRRLVTGSADKSVKVWEPAE